MPKKGAIIEVNNWGQPELPKKASQVYGKPGKRDHTGIYLDRDGRVQTVHYRAPEAKTTKGQTGPAGDDAIDDETVTSKPRPDVTQKGHDMIGDFRTDALHEALARAPIEDDMLMALLVLAFTGLNVRVDSGVNDNVFGPKRFKRHAARLFTEDGGLSFDMETFRVAARSMLIEVLSCRRGMSNSGVVSRLAGEAIGADGFLPNMGTEAFLVCLSRQTLEAAAKEANVQPRLRVRDTRSALVEHFKADASFVHPAALFAPDPKDVADLIQHADYLDDDASTDSAGDDLDGAPLGATAASDTDIPGDLGTTEADFDEVGGSEDASDDASAEHETAYGIAAE